MLSRVMEYFGLKRDFSHVGYFETEQQAQLFKELKFLLRQGRLVALSGVVGCGKTTSLERLQSELATEKDILLSRSLAIDKERVRLATLMTALFYDLATEKEGRLPTAPEQRERKLLSVIGKRRKPVVLFVDEAHDLHHRILLGIKRLMELVRSGGATLSVVLAGHPKLKNDLRRPHLEEIGARAEVFTLEGIRSHQRQYIEWLLNECAIEGTQPEDVLTEEAIALLAERLATPLQVEHYLRRALEEAHKVACKPVTKEIVEMVLSVGLEDLEPSLIRHGYNAKVLAELLNIRTGEVRSFFQGQLPPTRVQDKEEQMLKIGIPV